MVRFLLSLVLALTVLVGAPTSAHATPAVRTATLNVKASLPISAVRHDVRRALNTTDPDVIGFQEIGGEKRAQAMRALLDARGYRLVRKTHKPNAGSVPIAFKRSRFEILKGRTFFLSPATYVGPEGAGPATLREKRATWIVLRDKRTGRVHSFANAHLAPSLRYEVRSELHKRQVSRLGVLQDKIREQHPRAERHVLGDFNTEARWRLQPLRDRGLGTYVAPAKTHPAGRIDWHASEPTIFRKRVVRGFYTDHHLYLAVSH